MRLKLLVALGCASLAAAALAQDAAPSFRPEAFRAHVAFLADDLLEGRDAGSRGYDIAARYVAARFEALGLKPPVNGSWYQEVPFVRARLADAPARLTIGGRAFPNNGDVLIGPSAQEPTQAIEAPVVFVGYGLDAPAQGFNDYRGLDVKGKWVAVLSGYPKGTASELGAHLNAEKGAMAERRGAIGVIQIPTRQDMERRPWSRRVESNFEPELVWLDASGGPYSAAPGIRGGATLNTPAVEALFAGARRPLAAVLDEAAKDGGKPKGFPLKPLVKLERQSVTERVTSPNVIGMLPGSDPALAKEFILLTAHLDGNGIEPGTGGDRIQNGAMDNAAGIATILEVARAMAELPERPKRPILFAAVTAEEKGLKGAQYLARNPIVGDGKVVGVVNLDMPVLLYDFSDVVAFGADHSTIGTTVGRAVAQAGVALSPDPIPQEGIFTRSDHYRFVQAGVPSVMLMTGFAGEGRAKFEGFLRMNYHKVTDDLSQPFNWDAAAKFARINYLVARELADAQEAPRWYTDSFFGQTVGAGQAKAQRAAR